MVSEYKEVYKTSYESHTFDGDVAKNFVKRLIEVHDEIDKIPSKEMIFTEQDEIDYDDAKICCICQGGFSEKIKVRDHCHWTGKFRGAAHSSCNLRLMEQTFIPVIFHNLKGYNSHLFIKAFYDLQQKPSCIPQNTEKFISFSLKKPGSSEIRFLDSYAFMAFLLADLAGNLKEFPIMSKFFEPEEVEILSRKGVFPYKWFDDFNKLYKTRFPEHKDFFSKLSGKNITKEEYNFGQCE